MDLSWEVRGGTRLGARPLMKGMTAIIGTAAPVPSRSAPITHLVTSIALTGPTPTIFLMTNTALALRGTTLVTHPATTIALYLRGITLVTHPMTTIVLTQSKFVLTTHLVTIIVLAPRGTFLIIHLVAPGNQVLVMKVPTAAVLALTLKGHGTIHLPRAKALFIVALVLN
jgi:hypothetical protein